MLAATANRATYSGGDGQSVFPIPFPFVETRHLRAAITAGDGECRELVPGVDFAVNRVSDAHGELVLLGKGLSEGETLDIARRVPPAREFPSFKLEYEMDNHYFDDDGVYVKSAPANPGSMTPANALRVAPLMDSGFWPVLNARRDGWDLVEDHRGRKGWIGGSPAEISALGPLPEGWAETPPEKRLYLTVHGTYHREGCRYVKAKGEWLAPGALRNGGREAKACSLCRPDALEG